MEKFWSLTMISNGREVLMWPLSKPVWTFEICICVTSTKWVTGVLVHVASPKVHGGIVEPFSQGLCLYLTGLPGRGTRIPKTHQFCQTLFLQLGIAFIPPECPCVSGFFSASNTISARTQKFRGQIFNRGLFLKLQGLFNTQYEKTEHVCPE